MEIEPVKPNLAKGYIVDRAIDDATFILERIDKATACESERPSAALRSAEYSLAKSIC